MKFLDSARVFIKSGSGGAGCVSFHREKYVALGGPDGAMIGQLIQLQFGAVNNWPMGAALSIVLMLWISSIALVFVYLTKRADRIVA